MALFVMLVVMAALGLAELIATCLGASLLPARSPGSPGASVLARRILHMPSEVGVGLGLALIVLVVTRWPAAALVAFGAGVLWPRIVGGAAEGQRQLATVEALAVWTESLRDAARTSSGLEKTIPATAPGAPALLRRPLADLVSQLQGRVPLPEALAHFAADLDDPAADMVVAALALNARQRAQGLAEILTQLASNSRAELEMRRKIEQQRRAIRRESQLIAGGVLGVVAVQVVAAPGWVRPYDDPANQVVLVLIAALFVGGFARMRALARPDSPPRFLASPEEVTDVASYRPRLGREPS